MKALWLILSIALICLAHYIRVLRWGLFIEVYEKPNKRNMIRALSIGYLLNYIVPYKLGDCVRAYLASRKLKNKSALGFSTVIMDRYLDIISVGLIFGVLACANLQSAVLKGTAVFYILLAATLTAFTGICVLLKRQIKKGIMAFARLFNSRIELALLSFVWGFVSNFKNILGKISKLKLIGYTVMMWGGYLLSYFSYAAFLRKMESAASWVDIFAILFAENSVQASTQSAVVSSSRLLNTAAGYTALYMLAPLAIILLIAFLFPTDSERGETVDNADYVRLLPHLDLKERREFLELYFSDDNRAFIDIYVNIIRDVAVIRDYSAGSNATTLLCMDGKKTFYRKYALGSESEKLYQQICWIEQYRDRLPLPRILCKDRTDYYCYYDMAYQNDTVNLFEYVHSMPVEASWNIIRNALELLEGTIYRCNVRKPDDDRIAGYIESKVRRNLDVIRSSRSLSGLLRYDMVYINGLAHRNLKYYERFLTGKYLMEVFRDDVYAVIHGDLTVENIICVREAEGDDSFYIIDPNTGNIHDSPYLDYGKMLQSIHGGYEFFMSTGGVSVCDNRIDFLFARSSAYSELHERLRAYLIERYGQRAMKSIYFHEIVHWLRLLPYKLKKNEAQAPLFYAGLLMVMKDVVEMYGEDLHEG